MPPADLYGSKLKIERAYHHIRELGSAIESFLKTPFYRLHFDKIEKGVNLLKLEVVESIPPNFPLIIGDAIHNLHTALDHLACAITRASGKTPDRQTKFPFFKSRNEVIGAIKSGQMKAAGADIIDVIVDVIKPYTGGNDNLYGLHELDILDKHILVIPVFFVTEIKDVNAIDATGNAIIRNATLRVGRNGVLNALAFDADMNITSHGEPTIDLYFGTGQVFEGEPVLGTLSKLAQAVSGTLQAIEQVYLARLQARSHPSLGS